MKIAKYRLVARNQKGEKVASMDFAPTPTGRAQLKDHMKAFVAQAKENVIVRGYRVVGKYWDLGWYAINEATICFSSRRKLREMGNFEGLLILNRLQAWHQLENLWIDKRAEEEEQWRDHAADVLSRRG